MDDLLVEFLNETQESLDKLDSNLIDLEKNPNNVHNINEIFRIFHTIKGTSGFLELYRLGKLAHVAENLLSSYRAKEKEIETNGISLILKTVDRFNTHLEGIAQTGRELGGDDEDLIKLLEEELSKNNSTIEIIEAQKHIVSIPKESKKHQKISKSENIVHAEHVEDENLRGEELEAFISNLFDENVSIKETKISHDDKTDDTTIEEEEMVGELGRMILHKQNKKENYESLNYPDNANSTESFTSLKLTDLKKEVLDTVVSSKQLDNKINIPKDAKVRLDLLERLMDGVSELVLTRNQILQIQKTNKNKSLDVSIKRLNHITSELQEGIMKTRMQPIGTLWARLPRIVRDLSLELNKSIECSMYGEDTEIDRQVLEYMRDPIVHLVRNACDHGIELPEERIKAGKNESGVISVKAYQEGGHIYIEVSDDGKGIDVDKIRQKMISNGVITEKEAYNLPEYTLYNSVFEPGFTTSENVTAISGRGVGLDVVRSNINKIGGTVEIKSIKEEGSSFTVKIPLSLAIVNTLMISCYGQDFALPQLSVLKVGRITNDENMQIKYLNNHPVLQSRGIMYPLVLLEKILNLTNPIASKEETLENKLSINHNKNYDWENKYVLIVQGGSINFGLIVDDIHDTEEIVVKPLSRLLSSINLFSGNTILGDGRVIMILDPNGLSQSVQNVSRLTQNASISEESNLATEKNDKFSYLTFKDWNYPQRLGVNLLQVKRIEELNTNKIEYPSGKPAVIYNKKFMPVVTIGEKEIVKGEKIPALILFSKDRHIALLIKKIIDLVEIDSQLDISESENNIAGSVLANETVLDIVDIDYYFKKYLHIDNTISNQNEVYQDTVIIIESNPTRYAKYQQFFLQINVNNTIHTKAASALREFSHRTKSSIIYNKIFCSENMQDLSPFEFIHKLRQTQYGKNLDVYIICDLLTKNIENNYIKAGFKNCLSLDDFQFKIGEIYSYHNGLLS